MGACLIGYAADVTPQAQPAQPKTAKKTCCKCTPKLHDGKPDGMTAVEYRNVEEEEAQNNPFGIALYQPNYFLPYYHMTNPDDNVYQPSNSLQTIDRNEAKFQFSIKAPIWQHMFKTQSTLYLAYSQLSFWQAYDDSAFFRETDYSPELFVHNTINPNFYLDVGAVHQSNGYGGGFERSWNRIYTNFIFSTDHWMLSLEPWYALHDNSYMRYNPDLEDYMGYGQTTVSFKLSKVVLSFMMRNVFESGFQRPATQVTLSFPLTKRLLGYVQYYSGYGESLIEYNHRTQAYGVGIALNDLI